MYGNDFRKEAESFNLAFDESKLFNVNLSAAKRNVSRFLESLSWRFRDQRRAHVSKSSSRIEESHGRFPFNFNVLENSTHLFFLATSARPVSRAPFNHEADRPTRIAYTCRFRQCKGRSDRRLST